MSESEASSESGDSGPGPEEYPRIGGHIAALDGLRGVAILLVMLHHYRYQLTSERPGQLFLRGLMVGGWSGVDLFFVLSGFLITGILIDAKGAPHYFRNFYARRTLRIFPLYYASLAIFFFLFPMLPGLSYWRAAAADQVWFWTYSSNIWMAITGMGAPGGLYIYWSLAVEEQFYFVWPLLVWFLSRRRLGVLLVVLVVAPPLLRTVLALCTDFSLWGVYVLTITRADALAVGGLIALAVRGGIARKTMRRAALAALVVGLAMLSVAYGLQMNLRPRGIPMLTLGFSAMALVFGGLLSTVVNLRNGHWLSRLLRTRVLLFLGKYSYALYVFHEVFRKTLGPLEDHPVVLSWSAGLHVPANKLVGVLALGLALLLAPVSWYLFERRFLALKRFFVSPPLAR